MNKVHQTIKNFFSKTKITITVVISILALATTWILYYFNYKSELPKFSLEYQKITLDDNDMNRRLIFSCIDEKISNVQIVPHMYIDLQFVNNFEQEGAKWGGYRTEFINYFDKN